MTHWPASTASLYPTSLPNFPAKGSFSKGNNCCKAPRVHTQEPEVKLNHRLASPGEKQGERAKELSDVKNIKHIYDPRSQQNDNSAKLTKTNRLN